MDGAGRRAPFGLLATEQWVAEDEPHSPVELGAGAATCEHRRSRRPCHPRATRSGHERYPADNHGHSERTGRLSLTQKRSWELRLGASLSRPLRTGRVGVSCPSSARSALGPWHNGRARASAVTNGRPLCGGTAGHRPFGSSSWDNADERFRLWSRRSGFESPRSPYGRASNTPPRCSRGRGPGR
jgi:hypothetical protein